MPDLILASSVTIEVTGPAPVVWEQVEPSPVTVGVGSHLLIPGPPGPQGPAGPDGPTGSDGPSDHGALTGLSDDDHPQYLTTGRGDARYVQGNDSRLSDARTPTAHEHTAADVDSGASSDGQVLTSDGAGGAAWEPLPPRVQGVGVSTVWAGSQAAYDAISTPDPNTLYFVTG